MIYVHYMFLIASTCIFVHAAIKDFLTWKIRNAAVLVATASFLPFAFTGLYAGPELAAKADPISALAAAVTLFIIGFVLWLLKMLGAGDAKLMFPIGLFVGWGYLLPFTLGLLIFAVIALLGLKLPLPTGLGYTTIGLRLDEIRRSRKVPYGVGMVTALLVALYAKYVA